MTERLVFPRADVLRANGGDWTESRAGLQRRICELAGLTPEEVTEDADLLALGMDSIFVIRTAALLRRQGVQINHADLAESPTIRAWWGLVQASRSNQPQPPEAIEVDESVPFQLSVMQHAFWIGRESTQELSGVAAHFYTEFETDLEGVVPTRLEKAVYLLIARHAMLRLRIAADGTQHVVEDGAWPGLTVHDLRGLPTDETQARLDVTRSRLSHRVMDIAAGEVFDVQLSLLESGATRIHMNLDMVAADALSLRNILNDLIRLYEHPDEPLPPIRYSYPKYLAERNALRNQARESSRAWWTEQLGHLPGAPELPLDPDETSGPSVTRRHLWLSAEDSRRLRVNARAHDLTVAMTLATAFAETIGAWTSSERFLLNLPVFDREPLHEDVDLLVGDFSSSVMLDVDLSEEMPFAERARRIQQRLREVSSHAEYTGIEVLRDLSRLNRGSRVLAPVVYTSALDLGDLFNPEVRRCFGEPCWVISQGPQVWLDAQVTDYAGGVMCNWDARDSVFPDGMLDAMFDAYTALIRGLIDDEHAWSDPVAPMLPETQLAVRGRLNASAGTDSAQPLYERFFRRAKKEPGRTALCWGEDASITYGELAERALRMAALLRQEGLRAGDCVGVTLPKGLDQVVALLGTLAAGATYVPSGVDVPEARRQQVYQTAGVDVVLTDEETAQRAGWPDGVRPLQVSDSHALAPLDAPVSVDAESLMYIIFTSGSTGTPKGVEVPHRAVANTIDTVNEIFEITDRDRTIALSALDFDLSAYDVFAFLGCGGSVVLLDESIRRDASAWASLIRRWDVTVVSAVPALLDMLLVAGEEGGLGTTLRVVMLGGDWVTVDLPQRLRDLVPECRFAGLGGMTEAAIHATVCEVNAVDPSWRAVPYGVPLRNVACRVADHRWRDCPDWVPGELWVSGAGLAHGYHGDPERTAEKFVDYGGRRWYRTGDQARYRPDGTLEFLGRIDHQVKIRGHRIELGEIEAVTTEHPAVEKAIATVVTTASRQLSLAVVASRTDAPKLRTWLTERLPTYMVPEHLTFVESLPITSNGKIDRKLIHDMLETGLTPTEFTPPVGLNEKIVARIWQSLLDTDRVSRTDDFFALGGDSLLATRCMRALREAGLQGAELSDLFTTPDLARFASLLVRGDAEHATVISPDPDHRHDPFPLTEIQRAFWIGRDEHLPLGGVGSHFYLEFDGEDIDIAALEAAWNQLITRHEMLRAVTTEDGMQRILPEVGHYQIPVTTIRHRPEMALHRIRSEMSHRLFPTDTWPLFDIRAATYTVKGRQRTRLFIGLDSIVMDGRSIMVLYSEWDRLVSEPDADLPPLELSYRDYVLQTPPDPRKLPRAEDYWRARLEHLPPAPQLPVAQDPAAVSKPTFERLHHFLDETTWAQVSAAARAHGITPSVALLACYIEVLGAWSDQEDLSVNMTLFDRREVHPTADHVVGDFASLLLVNHHRSPDEDFTTTTRRLQEHLGNDLSHREASGIWVMRELARRTGSATAAFPVVFTSVLGIGDDVSLDVSKAFGEQVYGLTQTPQVWLDCKVGQAQGGVTIDWDIVNDLVTDELADAMFDCFTTLVESLAVEDWSGPRTLELTAAQADLRVAAAARDTQRPNDAPQGDRSPARTPGDGDSADIAAAVGRIWAELLGVDRVDPADSFFALGGDSILATRLMTRLRAEGLVGGELARLFTHPRLGEFSATISQGTDSTSTTTLVSDEKHRYDPFPLTDIQAAYWLGRSPDFTLGDIGAQLYLEYQRTDLDVDRLEQAWNRLIARHDMLRTVVADDGTQRVLESVPPFRIDTINGADDTSAALDQVREEMCHGVLDASRWPLFDIKVMTQDHGRSRLCVVFDNLATDGLSILTLLSEWDQLYLDPDAHLPTVGLSFRDYVLNAAPDPSEKERVLAYWRERMADLPPGPQLPLRTQPADIARPRFVRREHRLDTATWSAITDQARTHGVTPSVVLFACYASILGEWSAQRDLTVTMTLFDRRDVHPDINRVVGDFTSLLLVADKPAPHESWLERSRRLQEQLWRDLDHQQVSAVQVLRELARENSRPAEPVPVVFTSMLGVDDALAASVRWPDYTRSQTPQVWLDHQAIELPDGLLLSWDSVDELLPDGVIDSMMDAYIARLQWLAEADWSQPVPVALPADQRRVRDQVNATKGPTPEATPGVGTLHAAFFESAEDQGGDVTALVFGERRISHRELAIWAKKIAAMLIDHGARGGEPVAVRLPRGPEQVAAILGVVAAGAAYLPVSIDQPPVRRDKILTQAGARILITDEAAPTTTTDGRIVLTHEQADEHAPVEEVRASASSLAYVIFTSGSTGQPKGVEIEHRSAVNTLDDLRVRYQLCKDDTVLAVSATDFDLSVFDIFGLLAVGGTVVLVSEDERRDPQRWLELLHVHHVTVWNTVPALLDMLLTVAETGRGLPDSLRLVMLSGDWIPVDLPARLAALAPSRCRLIAMGGATEAAIWSNAFEVDHVDADWPSIPYGYPLRNQRFRVVDDHGEDRPDWVPGELWIGGDGIARGYRGDAELTAARFLEHEGLRWYRTGDLGRYWPDGTLEFLGRTDDQVKIRGHRIELGEVEAALTAHPAVTRAIVTTVSTTGSRRLVAFIHTTDETADLEAFLTARLPGYALPDVVEVSEFPLNVNGKIDRTALLNHYTPADSEPTAEPPTDEIERELATLWTQTLDLESVNRRDNFFTVGGDSLSATRLIQRTERTFDIPLSLRDFFADPTIAHLAEAIKDQHGDTEMEEGIL